MTNLYNSETSLFRRFQNFFLGLPTEVEVTPVSVVEPGIGVSLQTEKTVLRRFHREILKTCFHKHDLDSEKDFIASVANGDYVPLVAMEGNEILGGIVVEHSWSTNKKVMLIAWVAVNEKHRGRDIGTLLVNQAIAYAKANEALILLGEVENPDEFEEETSSYGNPVKRVKFYSRFGCQRLEIPYVVKMRNGHEEFGMMLTLFPLSEEQAVATEISSPELALFVKEFVEMDETESSEVLIEAAKGTVKLSPYRELFSS